MNKYHIGPDREQQDNLSSLLLVHMSNIFLTYLIDLRSMTQDSIFSRRHQNKESPFLASCGCYLDVGDDVVFKHNVTISATGTTSCIGLILSLILSIKQQRNLLASNIDFCTLLQVFHNETIWILVGWWLRKDIEHGRENLVALPQELIRTDLVPWIPATFIFYIYFRRRIHFSHYQHFKWKVFAHRRCKTCLFLSF